MPCLDFTAALAHAAESPRRHHRDTMPRLHRIATQICYARLVTTTYRIDFGIS